ncbi:MAG: four helix bundle protein [Bacteroidota bacterium]
MEKSYSLGLEIVKVCRRLSKKQKEYELARQLLKSGTSLLEPISRRLKQGSPRLTYPPKWELPTKKGRKPSFG